MNWLGSIPRLPNRRVPAVPEVLKAVAKEDPVALAEVGPVEVGPVADDPAAAQVVVDPAAVEHPVAVAKDSEAEVDPIQT